MKEKIKLPNVAKKESGENASPKNEKIIAHKNKNKLKGQK